MKARTARGLGLCLVGAGLACAASAWALPWFVEPSAQPLRPEMVLVLEGPTTFVMGSPDTEEGRDDDEAQREVTLTRPFLIARTEVTQAQYTAVMGSNPSCEEFKGVSLLHPDYPVQCVSWLDAVRYCNRLSELENLEPAYAIDGEDVAWKREARGYRLPTEAEWEFAARAGTRDVYAGTSDPKAACRFGNVADQASGKVFPNWVVFGCDDGQAGLASVGSYLPNAWFLFDLSGNVLEWTWDGYEANRSETTDPEGPVSGSIRVFRGGSWGIGPAWARVAYRGWVEPSSRLGFLGFRPARSL